MPPRRRTTSTNRRPRVAGTTPAGTRPDDAEGDGRIGTVTEPRPAPRTAEEEPPAARRVRHHPGPPAEPAVAEPTVEIPTDGEPADAEEHEADASRADAPEAAPETAAVTTDAATTDVTTDVATDVATTDVTTADADVDTAEPATERTAAVPYPAPPTPGSSASARSGGLLARLRTVPVLAGVLALLLAAALFFGVATVALRGSPAAANAALTDVATTAEVANQLGDALEVVYSYDFARLDENERAAREVITTGFSAEFERLFAQVRQLAPQQQAVVSATISVSAVREISGDRAVLVAFMDQQATTAANAEQAAAAGRLTVTGERVDGRWKIASVESR